MMRKLVIASAVATAFAVPASVVFAADAAPAAAPAPTYTFTGNVTLATEYIYRGIEQTYGKPAIQGGFDYAHTSGFYLGTWGSSITWVSDYFNSLGQTASVGTEIDLYGGYKNTFGGGDWSYDVGVLTYNYPGTYPAGAVKADTTEVYGAIGWKWLSAKYSYVTSDHIFGATTVADATAGSTKGSGYFDVTATYDLGNGWGVSGHYGKQTIKDNDPASYSDYRVGVTKDIGFGTLGLTVTDTNAKGNAGEFYNVSGRDLGKGRTVVTFTKTL
jgi:uncharacterized protein (TIGR02001 family)